MANTISATCLRCHQYTNFVYGGGNWECSSCGAYNTQCDSLDSETSYNSYDDEY